MRVKPLIVLGYHDISRDGDFLSWMRVNESAFDRQICFLKKIGTFIRPEDLDNSDRLRKNRLNFLLTFDDGYSNNYFVGYPIIKKHGIPALIFISTSNMQTGEPFWFDKIIQPIQRYNIDSLDLRELGLSNYRFSRLRDSLRWDGIQMLLEDIKRKDILQDGKIVAGIVAYLKRTYPNQELQPNGDNFQPISSAQILEMLSSGLCSFGSHGHQHTILTKLSDDELERELRISRTILQGLVGENIHHISYPNGNADERVNRACRDAGYRFGYTTRKGVVGSCMEEMNIPRVLIGGFDSTAKIVLLIGRELLRYKSLAA